MLSSLSNSLINAADCYRQNLKEESVTLHATDLINLDDYPIHQPGSLRQDILESTRAALTHDGCAVLKNFLTPQGVDALRKEADTVSDKGHRSYNKTNPYFTKDNPELTDNDPRRAFYDRSNNFIAADHFPQQGPLRIIHNYAAFDPFIKECLQEKYFYRYADPLADVIINMANEGNGFPWHFDTNNFTVTLAIQNAEYGGTFEYAPNIRRNGENFTEVRKVLDDASDSVVSLELKPGDLQLFRGRNSLHRVAPLKGNTPRYVAIFSYVEAPDMVATPERCKQLYGRALPIHYERAGLRNDNFID